MFSAQNSENIMLNRKYFFHGQAAEAESKIKSIFIQILYGIDTLFFLYSVV